MAKFWRPQGADPDKGAMRDAGEPLLFCGSRNRNLSLQQQRQMLPIFRYREQILYALEKYITLVLVGGGCSCLCADAPPTLLLLSPPEITPTPFLFRPLCALSIILCE
jgi:hypothetical protein